MNNKFNNILNPFSTFSIIYDSFGRKKASKYDDYPILPINNTEFKGTKYSDNIATNLDQTLKNVNKNIKPI